MEAMGTDVAVVLAGGQGTRIRHLLDGRPKPLADVAGRPFLEWILRYLRRQGIRHAVLSAGYAAGQIDAFAGVTHIPGLRLDTVTEIAPLGTGGGLVHAWRSGAPQSPSILALNGDSLALAPLQPLHDALEDGVDGAILGVRVPDGSRYGTLRHDAHGVLQGFAEKQSVKRPGLVNAGVYLFRRATLQALALTPMPLSMETQGFPALIASGHRLRVTAADAPFLDIGTPESLAQADAFIRDNPHWFALPSPID